MAKGQYMGVSGVARKVKKQYIGVDGVARKITKGYIGVDGVARQYWSSGFTVNLTGYEYKTDPQGYSSVSAGTNVAGFGTNRAPKTLTDVPAGTVVSCNAWGKIGQPSIILNGTTVKTGSATYSYTVTKDVTINREAWIETNYDDNGGIVDYSHYGKITITEN